MSVASSHVISYLWEKNLTKKNKIKTPRWFPRQRKVFPPSPSLMSRSVLSMHVWQIEWTERNQDYGVNVHGDCYLLNDSGLITRSAHTHDSPAAAPAPQGRQYSQVIPNAQRGSTSSLLCLMTLLRFFLFFFMVLDWSGLHLFRSAFWHFGILCLSWCLKLMKK